MTKKIAMFVCYYTENSYVVTTVYMKYIELISCDIISMKNAIKYIWGN